MKTYASPVQIDIPTDLSLTQLLHTSTSPPLSPSHLIATDSLTHRSLTLHELRTNAGRLAKGLSETFRPRDQARWAVILPNSCDYIELVHAILWTGGVVCPINHAVIATDIAHGLAITQPDFAVVYGPVIPKVEEAIALAAKQLPAQSAPWNPPRIISIVDHAAPGSVQYAHIPDDFASFKEPLAIPTYADARQRLATIHLSSGTTGKPKGVQLTHHNFVANVKQLEAHDAPQFHRGNRIVAYTPFAHIGNTTFPFFFGPYMGIRHHCMPAFALEPFAALVDSVKPTIFQGVPSVVLALADTDVTSRYDFSAAQKIDCGGNPFKPATLAQLKRKAPWRINQVYGMTEAAGYVAYQKQPPPTASPPASSPNGNREDQGLDASGPLILLPNTLAALRIPSPSDPTQTIDAPPNTPGELWLQAPNITPGYFSASSSPATANTTAFPAPGWYNTGDICTLTSTPTPNSTSPSTPTLTLNILGRTKDIIKYKNFQVSPTELESLVAAAHPDVLGAAVAGVWDDGALTEVPAAYVVLSPSSSAEEQRGADAKLAILRAIQAYVDARVSGYKRLRGGVWEVGQLPLGKTGKVVRGELRGCRTGLGSLGERDPRAKL